MVLNIRAKGIRGMVRRFGKFGRFRKFGRFGRFDREFVELSRIACLKLLINIT